LRGESMHNIAGSQGKLRKEARMNADEYRF
jgi:hypothetical protein